MRRSSEMYPIVERWLESSQNMQSFCDQEGLPKSVLSYWVSKYKKGKFQGGSNQRFVPLQVSGMPDGSKYMEVVFPTGIRLSIYQQVSLEELTQSLSKCSV